MAYILFCIAQMKLCTAYLIMQWQKQPRYYETFLGPYNHKHDKNNTHFWSSHTIRSCQTNSDFQEHLMMIGKYHFIEVLKHQDIMITCIQGYHNLTIGLIVGEITFTFKLECYNHKVKYIFKPMIENLQV